MIDIDAPANGDPAALRRIAGFYPTPVTIVEMMLARIAPLERDQRVLEPSAGRGDIADRLRAYVDQITIVEPHPLLAELLAGKGYAPFAGPFETFDPPQSFDRIAMNPPFAGGRDLDHVQRAFGMLAPGGVLVALMNDGAAPGDGTDEQRAAFVDWLRDVQSIAEVSIEQIDPALLLTAENLRPSRVPVKLVTLSKRVARPPSTTDYDNSGYWPEDTTTFDESEAIMLQMTCERAELADGQRILELGCGWGSLSLWMAEHYPKAQITSVSNSRTQKEFIDAEAAKRGLTNLTIVTANMVSFEGVGDGIFDRCVSVEMFEYMKNYQEVLRRLSTWLKPGGKLFVHIFTHREYAYHFEATSDADWMAKYFFTGGQMPSDDLLLYFQDHLQIDAHWCVNGMHYSKTSKAWLSKMDANKAEIMPLFRETYGEDQAVKWWSYWRIFYMACAELWGYRDGEEWIVSHYRFAKPV